MKKRINIMIDDDLLEAIDKESKKNYISRSSYISLAVSNYLLALEFLKIEKKFFEEK